MKITRRWLGGLLAGLFAILAVTGGAQAAERYKPYVLAWRGNGDAELFKEKVDEVRQSLADAGFEVVTVFNPYAGSKVKVDGVDEARIVVFTSPAIKKVAVMTKYGAFAVPQRASVTRVGNDIQVAYYNPVYMAHAYRLKSDLSRTAEALAKVLGRIEEYGAKRGLTKRKLRKYHYTFGMEYFDDVYELASYRNYKDAVAQVEKHLANNDLGVSKIYRIDLPGKKQTIFGVRRNTLAVGGDKYADDAWIMSNVDFEELKMTPYLPYEVLVDGKDVVALHMRFRMAVSRPSLRMMGKKSFMNLMPSPKAIEKVLTLAVGGELEE